MVLGMKYAIIGMLVGLCMVYACSHRPTSRPPATPAQQRCINALMYDIDYNTDTATKPCLEMLQGENHD